MKRVDALKKKLLQLSAVKSAIAGEKQKEKATREKIQGLRKQLDRISYHVTGLVAPGATLWIRFGEWEKVYTTSRNNHLNLRVAGEMGDDGSITEINLPPNEGIENGLHLEYV